MKLDLNELLSQAQKMQEEVAKKQSDIASKTVEAEAGGGMVKVKMNGNHKLLEIKIAKELINPSESEMLEDLIVAAVNNGIKEIDQLVQNEMGSLRNMMPNIPGMGF